MADLEERLTWAEFNGWCQYFEYIHKATTPKPAGPPNLVDATPEQMIRTLTG